MTLFIILLVMVIASILLSVYLKKMESKDFYILPTYDDKTEETNDTDRTPQWPCAGDCCSCTNSACNVNR